jgi:hypothetical protein
MDRTIEICLMKFMLFNLAKNRDGEDITPIRNLEWDDCFTVEIGRRKKEYLCLWYNVKATQSSKIVKFHIS